MSSRVEDVTGQADQSATFDSVTITVLQGTVDIKGNGPEWRALLVGALGVDGLTVRLAENVDMDMSGLNDIYIRKGVKLIAGQPCQLTNAPPWLGLVAFDPSAEWSVEPPFASRSRNTAFLGRTLRGRVVHTMLAGELVVADGKAQR